MNKVILIQTDVGYFDYVLSKPDLPLALLRIASLLKSDHELILIDARRTFGWRRVLNEALRKDGVVCVGISAMLGKSIKQGLEMSAFVKKSLPRIPIIWGGKLPTLAAQETLQEQAIDIVIRGEGEITFNALVRAIEEGKSYAQLEGISYRNAGDIIHNPGAPVIDLNELPVLPFDLIDVGAYAPVIGGRKTINYETSRGCPIGCPFCYNTLEGGMKWRGVSPARVIEDVGYLSRTYGIEHVYFVDDNLFCDIARLRRIAEGFLERKCGVTWDTQGACLEDIYAISDRDLRLLKESGLIRLAVGIQSGSSRIRELIASSATDEKVFEVNRKLKEFAIRPHYYFMIGFPGETEDDRRATVKLALQLLEENKLATTSSFSCFAPWPGTTLFEFCRLTYGLKAPASLECWTRDWDYSNVPWFTGKEKARLHNLFQMSMLYDKKADWYSNSRLIRFLSVLYRPIAKFRMRHMCMGFLPESKLIDGGKMILMLKHKLRGG